IQAGIYTSNQMGFHPPPEEVRRGSTQTLEAPVPDFLAAYGELSFAALSTFIAPQNICLSGPIRYAYLNAPAVAPTKIGSDVLLTTSIARDESLALLKLAFEVLSEMSNASLLIKFHYHM